MERFEEETQKRPKIGEILLGMDTPKKRFQVSGSIGGFSKMVATMEFETACDYALLQLSHELSPNITPNLPTDPYVGIDANAQRHGAFRVIEILKHLADPEKEPTQLKTERLNYASPSSRPSRTLTSNDPAKAT